MIYLKSLIQSIEKRKIQYFLFFLQMIIIFLVIQYTTNLLIDEKMFHQKINSLKEIETSSYFAVQDSKSNEMPDCSFEEYAKFKEEVNQVCGNTAFSFGVSDLTLKTDKIPKKFLVFEENMTKYYSVTYITENFLEYYNIYIEYGKIFSKEMHNEISSTYIPMILGADYQQYFQVGDIIDQKYEVIGILEKKASYLDIQLNSKLVSLDDQILLPMIYQVQEWGGCYVNHLAFVTDYRANIDRIKRIIEEYHFKDYYIEKTEAQIKMLENDFYTELSFLIILCLTCCILCFFSVISMLLHLIEEQKTEFGIHMLCGATKINICFIIVQPIVILSVVASIPSMVLCPSILLWILQILCVLVIIMIIIIFPLRYWLKKPISELKKERK